MAGELTRRDSQGYSHACQRAELLGLPTPSEAEWLASEERASMLQAQENDDQDIAAAQELDASEESSKRIGGGLDELNAILSVTQKKINKFKNVCGSLGTLLKARVSSQTGTPEHQAGSSSEPQFEGSPTEENQVPENSAGTDVVGQENEQRIDTTKKAELNTKLGSHIDKLDSLISKAENAQYSMKNQTKQMKAFLK
ncbi:uncharacterized protein LOC106658736 [Trichogramma pretiosum]|uniref:uncharacterized protein LOC106658736 n=1 Tax=Trichogramma pretiosum TaxID=7493 RepID=UPI0006C9C3C1|nr:uncharacterized protein LOC106658736 [Trichogramma pretiosum]